MLETNFGRVLVFAVGNLEASRVLWRAEMDLCGCDEQTLVMAELESGIGKSSMFSKRTSPVSKADTSIQQTGGR
jgi:hypothetical protein